MIAPTQSHMGAHTVLVVSDNALTQTVIREYAKGKGYSVNFAIPALGLSTFYVTQPDIVVVDLVSLGQEGIMLVKQVRERRPTCSIILLTDAGHGESMDGVSALDYIHQPIQEDEFAQAMERAIPRPVASVVDAPDAERRESVLVIASDPSLVEGAVTWLIQSTALGLGQTQRIHLRATLQELVMNAVEHGCLDLRCQDKLRALANDQYDELIRGRRRAPYLRDRKVTIRAIYERKLKNLSYQIADEGKGFDWKEWVKSGFVCPPGDVGGRGIFLAQSFFPEIKYNDVGNEVMITVPLE